MPGRFDCKSSLLPPGHVVLFVVPLANSSTDLEHTHHSSVGTFSPELFFHLNISDSWTGIAFRDIPMSSHQYVLPLFSPCDACWHSEHYDFQGVSCVSPSIECFYSILKHSALQSGLLQFLHALLQIILSRSPLSPPLRLLMAFHGWHADSRSKFCLLLLNLVLTYLGHLSRTELCLHIVCFLCACANFSLVLLPSRRHWR